MLFLKKPLYYMIIKHAEKEKTTFHQVIVRAVFEYLKIECDHYWHSTEHEKRFMKYIEAGKFICEHCGYATNLKVIEVPAHLLKVKRHKPQQKKIMRIQ